MNKWLLSIKIAIGLSALLMSFYRVQIIHAQSHPQAKIEQMSFFVAVETGTYEQVELYLTDQNTELKEMIVNGDFETPELAWSSVGTVSYPNSIIDKSTPRTVAQLSTGELSVSPHKTQISQEVDFGQQPVQAVSFWFQVFTREDLNGFDEPCLSVYLDDDLFYQINRSDLVFAHKQEVWVSDGQQIVLSLPTLLGKHTLTFEVVNTIDAINPTWVYIDDVTTKTAIIHRDSRLHFNNSVPVQLQYRADTQTQNVQLQPGETFLFLGVNNLDRVSYQVFNPPTPITEGQVFIDSIAPVAVRDLRLLQNIDTTFSLSWTAPYEQTPLSLIKAQKYEIRWSKNRDELIAHWQSLPLLQPVNGINNNLTLEQFLIPQIARQLEIRDFLLTSQIKNTYLGLKSFDAAGNMSGLSNILFIPN